MASLKYGKQFVNVELKKETIDLSVKEPDFEIDKDEFYKELFATLPAGKDRYRSVAVIISDKTRLCGYPEYLPWVTDVLIQKGTLAGNITFYVAYGTHPRQTEEESLASYGETYKQFRFVHHDCYDEESITVLGTTKRGTPITVRKDVLESSLIITFGAISHHYFAAYGGGRKLLFPGLAKREAVYYNHGLFLDREKRILEQGCRPGNLEGNPIAEDLKEIDDKLPSKISIHGILNSKGEVRKLLFGTNYSDFSSACKLHDRYFRSAIKEQFDLVIASGGGYPKDINFIQAHKAMHNASAFVRDGGKLIILAECIDGIGSKYFMQYLEAGGFDNAFSILEKNYEGNGGTALSMMTKTNRIGIYMLTSLKEQSCKTLNVTKLKESDILTMINAERGSVAVIQNASMLVR
ncbi:MAG: nickel-dependent lactate racemase [Bacteroidales bacterium]|nr:nickel-dependent lactate racemase [Bacteroidales bacterium]